MEAEEEMKEPGKCYLKKVLAGWVEVCEMVPGEYLSTEVVYWQRTFSWVTTTFLGNVMCTQLCSWPYKKGGKFYLELREDTKENERRLFQLCYCRSFYVYKCHQVAPNL